MKHQKQPSSPLKLALIADDLTRVCLAHECRVMNVTPGNYRAVFKLWKPDILFVESAWEGRWKSWKYGIAAYPDHPERNNGQLARVVAAARDAHIPAVFWNREDGAHFKRFIASARLFDHVFTVDENMIPHYRAALGEDARVEVMMFAAQPAIHSPADTKPLHRAAFVGSYSRHVHPHRRHWQDMVFRAADPVGVTVYDRNSNRRPDTYRYPEYPWIEVKKTIAYNRTGKVYNTHAVNLNVNTVTDSTTAFSRRLVEILACGGFALTNPTPAVARFFGDYCATAENGEEAHALFARIAKDGLSHRQREQGRAAAAYVLRHHTWRHRLEQLTEMVA